MNAAPATRAAVGAAAVTASMLVAHQVVSKATRDALFLSTWGVALLPRMMIGAALFSLASVLITARLLARYSPARVVPIALVASAGFGAIEWLTIATEPYVAALMLYFHLSIFGATTISAFWSLLNERFDTRTVKRVVARVASGGTVGGVVGGLIAFYGAQRVGLRGTIAAGTVLHVLSAILVHTVARATPARPSTSSAEGARSGFQVLREVRYLRDLAAIVFLLAAVNALLDFTLSAHATATIGTGPPLLSFFALFHMSVGLLTFFAQAVAGRLALERLGAARAIAVLPTIALLGSIALLPNPRLLSVAMVRGAAAISENSLFRAGYELLFTPIPVHRKRPTKTLIDVGFERGGTALGAVLAMIIARSSQANWLAMVAIGIASAMVLLIVARTVPGGYVRALADNLRLGAHPGRDEKRGRSALHLEFDRRRLLVEVEKLRRADLAVSGEFAAPLTWPRLPEEQEPTETFLADVAALLGSDSSDARREAAQGILERGTPLDPRLVPHVISLLGSPALSDRALEALRRVAERHVGQLVDALLDPNTPFEVRGRLPRVLSRCESQRAVDGLLSGLDDQRFEVRWACGLSLLHLFERHASLTVPRDAVLAAIRREIGLSEQLWDAAPPLRSGELELHGDDSAVPFADQVLRDRTSRSLQHVFALLALLYDREAMHIALRALVSEDHDLRGVALEYLENVLPEDVRERLWPYVGDHRRLRPIPRRAPHAVLEELLRSGAIERPTGLPRRT